LEKIRASEVLDLVEYEKARDAMRARVIDSKRHRRLSVGDNLTLLFENRETVLFQIQEMVRAERIVADDKLQEELDAYNALIPGPGQLSATLFLEIPGITRLTRAQVHAAIDRFRGLDREGLRLQAGPHAVPAAFEGGHSNEEKMAAVHYLKFTLPRQAQAALADPAQPLQLVVDHPHYRAQADVPPAMRAELLRDLA
jgi:hypothetical protein